MERVSFKVAKAIKEAGYPIEVKSIEEAEKLGWQGNAFFTGTCTCGLCPYVMDVWLWLWREKRIYIQTNDCISTECNTYILGDCLDVEIGLFEDPEEAIIAAIEYLVDNKLLK